MSFFGGLSWVASTFALTAVGGGDASGGDVDAVALIRGPAIVNRHDLVFTGTPTEPEIDAAHTALLVAGILVR